MFIYLLTSSSLLPKFIFLLFHLNNLLLDRQSWNSPKTSSMTGDMRKEAVTRAAARIMKVRAPEVTIAVAVFRFCRSMSPWRLGGY